MVLSLIQFGYNQFWDPTDGLREFVMRNLRLNSDILATLPFFYLAVLVEPQFKF